MKKKKLAGKLADREKSRLKRKAKRGFRHFLLRVFGAAFLFAAGYLFGLHHKMIVAFMKGEELPKAPKNCPAG